MKYAAVSNHLWELSHIANCKYFHIERHGRHDATTAMHTHNFIQIYYVHHGQMQHTVLDICGTRFSSALLTAGDLFILPPWFYHQISQLSDDLLYTSICFAPEFIYYDFRRQFYFCNFINYLLASDSVTNDACPKSAVSFKQDQGKASSLLHSMEEEYTNREAGFLTNIKGDLLKLLVIIARQYCDDQKQTNDAIAMNTYYELICQSMDYINMNFAQDLKIDDVAKRFFVSRTYFCTLFKRISGYTFYEYINNLRLNHSKALLQRSNYSITEIAHRSGFNDISNYCRQFKKTFGVPPSHFRKPKADY